MDTNSGQTNALDRSRLQPTTEAQPNAWKPAIVHTLAVVGLLGGPAAGAIGAVLLAWLTVTETLTPALHILGSVLLLSLIPSVVLGAHCLDLIEKRTRPTRPVMASEHAATTPQDTSVADAPRHRALGVLSAIFLCAACVPHAAAQEPLSARERVLLERLETLEKRVADLEAVARSNPSPTPTPSGESSAEPQPEKDPSGPFEGVTVNLMLDGYYGYNFNRPSGAINVLRPYDPTSNSFNLAQAVVALEQAPDIEKGRRYGMRLDFQFGQATETVQGSAVNELRPQVWRHVLQAYGTYVVPVGKGLTVDFGKWTSALGVEGHYAKDQINYSRSYYFNFLPYYHSGLRASYPINDRVSATYWLVNGAQQTEDANGFKSQALLLNVKPTKSLSWSLNYYTGLEGRAYVANLNPTFPTEASQPGLPTTEVHPVPRGRLHVVDTYATWTPTDKTTLVGEFDYVVNRTNVDSPPAHVVGGAAYARYQISNRHAVAARGEYLSDRGGLFSGATQALKEVTATYEYKCADGFLARLEWRRDASNQPLFLTSEPGARKREQNTATIGLIWWLGAKQGSW